MKQSHRIVRKAHAERLARRASLQAGEPLDGPELIKGLLKTETAADKAEIVDTEDLDAFEHQFAAMVLAFLEHHPTMQVTASKTAYEILRTSNYKPSLARQMCVGAQALAVEVVMNRMQAGLFEVFRQLSLIEHEKVPALIDDSLREASDVLRARFAAERQAGSRPPRKPWLFGPGAGVPPAERKRLALEARVERRRLEYERQQAGGSGEPDGVKIVPE